MNELHLFAGSGGGILGGILCGHTCVCAVEIEPYCRQVLLQRQRDGVLPWFPIWDDVRTFDGKPWRGIVDIVCGGFPCQDISVAGHQTGLDGERSGLWKEMRRIIGEIQPRFTFVENSPNLALLGGVRVVADLTSMGFGCKWGIMGAGSVGSVCEGERLWIFATSAHCSMLESVDVPAYIQPYSEKSRRRQYSRAIGAMLSQDDYSALKRNPNDVARGMDRLKAIGNGQVPRCAALAWRILSKVD